MRQVPSYLLIGNGRLARHLAYYFSLLNLPYKQWYRSLPLTDLQEKLAGSTHCLVLINDDAIESFIHEYLISSEVVRLHCSGSLVTSLAYGVHPLMSFSTALYSLDEYQSIPFIVDSDAPPFDTLLPGLPNPHWRLPVEQKAKYHALCVMSGNFSCLLWQKLLTSLEHEFHLPAAVAHPYLQRQMQNLIQDHQQALTGPLTRNDTATLQKNLTSLNGDPFQKIYETFMTGFSGNINK